MSNFATASCSFSPQFHLPPRCPASSVSPFLPAPGQGLPPAAVREASGVGGGVTRPPSARRGLRKAAERYDLDAEALIAAARAALAAPDRTVTLDVAVRAAA